ncbi:hypothetical protein M408DRAFT_77303 [Serendipita vermifera MAFF 305830]|uniref:Nephrocystin 3-like N-terminal domain-containing protein n=1 Tax=Serendipita vermifera MAFF 305830 TaxID=933852 RepID=A0A0C2X2J0_SERVB|nr:hypothetical protein M408DRAFT_77303 [Serendipita vermifera MAFF 305830]
MELSCPVRECMEGTREDVIATVLDWVVDYNAANIFWLKGHPGVGKSAIATSLVEKLRRSERLGSSFFFQRAKADSMTPNALWRIVAYDLAHRYPKMGKHLIAALEKDESLVTIANSDELFRGLVQTPIMADKDINEETAAVVVIDALDECGGLDGRHSTHRINLMRTFKRWSTLPKRLKIVVTSRTEPDVVQAFSTIGHESFEVLSGSLVHFQSSEDIERFLKYHLSQIAAQSHGALPTDWPGHQNIKWLTRIAAGLFIWADTAIQFLKQGEPQEQLNHILGGASMGGLATLFSSILGASFREPSEKVIKSFHAIVGTIILAKDPLPAASLAHLCSVDFSTLSYIRNGLQSLTGSGEVLRFSHLSFMDFLIDPKQCRSAFWIDLPKQKRELTLSCLKIMKAHLRFNICEIKSSHGRNKDIVDLDQRVKECIPYHVSYSAHHWAEHLKEAEFDTEILGYIEYFMKNQFLFWLEVLSLTKRVNIASYMILLLIGWLRIGKQSDMMAVDMKKFLAAFGSVISQSMPHIYISALAFSPQNSLVFREYTKCYPQRVQIERGGHKEWPAIQKVVQGHQDMVLSVAFSPNGKRIVSGSEDRTIRVWDAETAEMVAGPFKGHTGSVNSVAVSPDGTRAVSGSGDTTLRVWDIETAEMIAGPFEGHNERINSVKFSPDGTRVISGSEDKTIRIWDAETAEMLVGPFEGHTASVSSVAFSPNGTRIVSGSWDSTIRVWNAANAEMVAGIFEGHNDVVTSVTFSPDGTRIVSGSYDGKIRVWDAETLKLIARPFEGHAYSVMSVEFSGDGTRIVSGSTDMTIRVWDATTTEMIVGPLDGHKMGVASVAFSPDGTTIVSGSHDATIRIWGTDNAEMITGTLEGPKHCVNSVSFSPDGTRITFGSADSTVQVWDPKTAGIVACSVKEHTDAVTSVAFSLDGTRIVSGSWDSTIRVWNAANAEMVAGPFEGHTNWVTSVAFSPDGKHIVSGSYDETIRLWNAKTSEMVAGPFEGHTWVVTSVAFSPDGARIVSGSEDQTIRIWDAESAEMLAESLDGHTRAVNAVAFSLDGTRIVSGSDDRTVRVWDAETLKIIARPFEGHTGDVISVAYSPDGTRIVSGSYDRTIRVWDARTSEMVAGPLMGHVGTVFSVAFSPDGARVVSGSEDEIIRIWHITASSLPSFADTSKLVDGWILGPNSELLFSVPPALQMGLFRPGNTLVIGQCLVTKLNLEHFVHGEDWIRCRDPLPEQAIHGQQVSIAISTIVRNAKRKVSLHDREEEQDARASGQKRIKI